jgi:hypothetical protein
MWCNQFISLTGFTSPQQHLLKITGVAFTALPDTVRPSNALPFEPFFEACPAIKSATF